MAYSHNLTLQWAPNVDYFDYEARFKFNYDLSFEDALKAAAALAEPKLAWDHEGATYTLRYAEPVIKLEVDDKTPVEEVVKRIFAVWGKSNYRIDADSSNLAPETHHVHNQSVSTALRTLLAHCNPPLVDDELEGVHYISVLGTEGLPPVLTQSGHSGRVLRAEYSPDRSVIATYGEDGFIVLWSTADGHTLATIQGILAEHGLSLKGEKLVYARGSTAFVYDIARKRSFAFGQIPGEVSAIAFAPNAGQAIVADRSGNVRVFSIGGGAEIYPPKEIDPITKASHVRHSFTRPVDMVSISSDGKHAAFHLNSVPGSTHDALFRLELPSGVATGVSTLGQVAQLGLNAQGTVLFAVTEQGWLSYWRTGEKAGHDLRARASETQAFVRFAIHPDGRHIAFGYRDKGLRIANIDNPDEFLLIPKVNLGEYIQNISCVSYGPTGADLILGVDAPDFVPSKVFTYNLGRREITLNLRRNMNTIYGLQFTAEGNLLIVNDGTGIRIWDPSMKEFPRSLDLQTASIQPHVKSEQEYLVAGSNRRTGQLERWYVPLGRKSPVPVKRRFQTIDQIVWSGDGQSFAVHEVDGSITVWGVSSEAPAYTFPERIQNLSGFAINDNGSKLALCVGGQNGYVKIFDLASMKEPVFKVESEPNKSKEHAQLHGPFAVASRGDRLAYQDGDTLEVVHFSNGAKIASYDGQNASFSEDGALLGRYILD
jgi:WD40 repeat protein